MHCLQKKLLNRKSKQGSHNEVTIPAVPECRVHSTSSALFYFFLLFNFVRYKEVGSALNDCATLFTSKKGELLTGGLKAIPASPICLSGCWGRKPVYMLKEEAGRGGNEIQSKKQTGPRCPRGC